MFHTWVLHGRGRAHEWMALSLASFGSGDVVSRLTPYTRDWAHSDPRACVTLVDVLSAIETNEARLELVAIGEVARAPVLLDAVKEALGDAGIDAPHRMELDSRGEALLDLGSRQLRVVLDELLVPRVVLEDGHHVGQVPRPRKGDDPHLASVATAQFKRLTREAKIVARTGLRRLEQDMVAGRRYRVSELEARFIQDPLLGHAVRRLVWTGPTLFRVALDGSYADDSDLPLSLDPDAMVAIIHPVHLSDSALSRWGTLFADYEIVQPFDQLGRITFKGTRTEADALFKSTAGRMVEARALLSMLHAHGWVWPPGRRVANASREVPRASGGTERAIVSFAPGIALDQVRKAPAQKLGAITFPGRATQADFEPVVLSELVRTALTLSG